MRATAVLPCRHTRFLNRALLDQQLVTIRKYLLKLLIKGESARWQKVVKDANIKAD